ncbi:hypothetical protein [Clostridium sp. 2218st1_F5_2218SCRN_220325]
MPINDAIIEYLDELEITNISSKIIIKFQELFCISTKYYKK